MQNMSRRAFLGSASMALMLAACGNSGSADAPAADDAATDEAAGYTLVTEGKLTCVAELGFAPFEYMEDDGTVVGFDIDVAAAVAEKLGLEAEWLPNQQFDTLVPIIKQGGKADIAIAGITITDARLQEVDFSDPYIDSNQGLVIKAGSGETEETLNDASKKVACQSGTTGEEWIAENLPNAQRVNLEDVAAAMAGVQTGLYDGFVIDLPVCSNLIAQSYQDLEVGLEIPTGEQYGIAISKDNPGLTAAVNQALADMDADGTMAAIQTKWFGSEI